jgi:proton translocating ATP synthase F1 alpha subunit
MAIKASEISDLIKQRIEQFDATTEARDEGTVVSVTDGIVRVHGLANVAYGEMLDFGENTFGLALNLERDSVGAVVLGEYGHISEGNTVSTTGRILEVPVGDALLGRVVNPLGVPIDGKGPIDTNETSPIEKVAPGVISRQSVDQPVQTGLKSIDSMVPIGRGQREPPSTRSSTRRAPALSASTWRSGRNARRSPTSCARSRNTARWITPSSWQPRPRSPRRSSTSPLTPVAPWVSISATRAKTR